MGSSFSILNDTEHHVWISHGINWEILIAVYQGISFLLTTMAAAGAEAGEEGARAGGRSYINNGLRGWIGMGDRMGASKIIG